MIPHLSWHCINWLNKYPSISSWQLLTNAFLLCYAVRKSLFSFYYSMEHPSGYYERFQYWYKELSKLSFILWKSLIKEHKLVDDVIVQWDIEIRFATAHRQRTGSGQAAHRQRTCSAQAADMQSTCRAQAAHSQRTCRAQAADRQPTGGAHAAHRQRTGSAQATCHFHVFWMSFLFVTIAMFIANRFTKNTHQRDCWFI